MTNHKRKKIVTLQVIMFFKTLAMFVVVQYLSIGIIAFRRSRRDDA